MARQSLTYSPIQVKPEDRGTLLDYLAMDRDMFWNATAIVVQTCEARFFHHHANARQRRLLAAATVQPTSNSVPSPRAHYDVLL